MLEIKNMMLEKSYFNELKIRLDTTVGSITELEDRPIEIIQNETEIKEWKQRDEITQKLKYIIE